MANDLETKIANAEAYASEYVNPRDFSSSSVEQGIWKAVRAGYLQGQDDRLDEMRKLHESLRDALGHSNCYCERCKHLSDLHWTPKPEDKRE